MAEAKLTYEQVNEEQVLSIHRQLLQEETKSVLKWAYESFGEEILYSCSFGAEGVVLIDLIAQIRPEAEIIFLDTHVHFQETYQLIEEIKERYPRLQIKILEPELTLAEQADLYEPELWKTKPDVCCQLRKIKPLEQALQGKKAWISGLRREQSPTRAKTQFVNQDHRFQSIKVCPLIYWSWEDVWSYIRENDIPYNVLHDQQYPSIGCQPCTLPVEKDGDSRAGRWATQQKTECGLHNRPSS